MPALPPITRALLISTGLVFVLQLMLGENPFLDFMLWPLGEHPVRLPDGTLGSLGFLPWQLVTYGFLHGGLAHLFFNLLALVMFGAVLEQTWGSRRFALYYFVCVIGAGLVQLAVVTWALQQGGGLRPTIGASGGVFGLLLAYGMLYPNHRLMLIFPPIPMKARNFVILYGLAELVLGVTGTQAGVAHFAHLGGMLFGFLLLQYWRGRWPFASRPRS